MKLAKYGFSDDCEGCRVAQMGAEATPHCEGCRERIRHAMMNDVGSRGHMPRSSESLRQEQSVATRVEAAQEGPVRQ